MPQRKIRILHNPSSFYDDMSTEQEVEIESSNSIDADENDEGCLFED